MSHGDDPHEHLGKPHGHPGDPVAAPAALRRGLIGLCVTEITSWGVLIYAFPVVVTGLTRDTGWSLGTAMTAFSTGMVVAALAGVPVGRLLDRVGPRPVMTSGSVLAVVALLGVAAAPTIPWFFAAWAAAGLAQAAVLYPPAFATLTRWYGRDRMPALTTLSLVAGFASTVFAPVTAMLSAAYGWRATFAVLAVILGLITIPVHAIFLELPWPGRAEHDPRRASRTGAVRATAASGRFLLLSAAMALAAFGLYAATVNLVPLFISRGTGEAVAAAGLAVCGVGQVLGRVGYPALTRRTAPRTRSAGILGVGAAAVLLLAVVPGPLPALIATAAFAGAARGAFTLLQATAVSDRWGVRQFGALNGLFIAPATMAVAVAPAGGALLADRLGGFPLAFGVLTVVIALGTAGAAGVPDRR